ncbi:nucleoid-associated protein [Pontibacter sp. G13]|uniref:nucleoid-associated protein n=1 Tax=Pontibacter sp. G13 TaxID=3074898 RepID=UPI00288908AE|nr:nucleoid-associated protein [Pontibacter sp. G13]WNJ18486.1 nucleoid-associated protein [Pontibacter sp. G13]
MIDLSNARLTTLAVHKVGNKSKKQGYVASKSLVELDERLAFILQDYYLKPFKAEEFFKFSHPVSLEHNMMYKSIGELFSQSREEFLDVSHRILMHLYDRSQHPYIKSGELHVAHFRECVVDGVELEAIGIFKSEIKDMFLKVDEEPDAVSIEPALGINVKKLDKGCLIFKTFEDDGFSVLMINKVSEDTQYWRDEFLQVQRLHDHSYQTENFMNLTRDFCDEVLSREEDKKEQVMFLNKSMNYFMDNQDFDMNDFKKEVFPKPETQEKFDTYRKDYEQDTGLAPAEEGFEISKYAVRTQKKNFKSIIKLDTPLEIRIDPKRLEDTEQYLERCYDEQRDMFYYRVYFNEEMES